MEQRILQFNKSGQHYCFRYAPGAEAEVIDQLMTLAEDSATDLDWLDAATLSYQVAQEAAGNTANHLPRRGPRLRRAS